MNWLRNLSIAGKISLAAAATLVLVGVLAFTAMSALQTLRGLGESTQRFHSAARDASGALLAARAAQLAALDLQFQQTLSRVEQSRDAAQTQGERVESALDQIAEQGGEATRAQITRTKERLADYMKAVSRAAELRGAMLSERDNTFSTVQSRFDTAIAAVRRDLALEDLMPSEIEEIQEHIRQYQLALLNMRDATNLFLATGDNTLSERVRAADQSAETHLPSILRARISDDFREGVDDMAAAALKMRQSAHRLFDAASELGAHAGNVVTPAAMALEAQLGAVVRAFDETAEAALADADVAQDQARQWLPLVAFGIAIMLVVSGVLTVRAIAGPIGTMTKVVQRMAEGDTEDTPPCIGRRDEIGRMATALEVLRQAVRKAFLQGQVIEQMPLGVATAAAAEDFRLTVVNPELTRLVTSALAGQSVEALFEDPSPIRAVIADPELLPHRLRVASNGRSFDVSISALTAPDGSYAGPMLAWRDISDEVGMAARFEHSIGRVVGDVGTAADAVQATATAMTEATAASAERLIVVAGASREATSSVQSVARNAEQLAESVEAIARSVSESAAIARTAVAEAEATDQSVAGLSEAAGRIGEVVRLIGDIAERTNLLALNATIEAARAGEAGRGFAVVASEVKALANQTAKATGDIANQITAMQGATGQAVGALRSIARTIQRMYDISGGIAAAVAQQGAATQEIAHAVQQAAAGTAGVDANIGEVTGTVQHTGEQAAGFAATAARLGAQSSELAHEVREFLAHLQAA